MTRPTRLTHYLFALVLFLVGSALARADIAPPSLHEPTVIHTYLYLEDINDIKLGTGTYDITALLVQRWKDARLAHGRPGRDQAPQIWMGQRAEKYLETLWHPILDVTGEKGLTASDVHSLAIHPDGTVVLRQKFTGTPRFKGELTNFPFGRLSLELNISSVAVDDRQMRFELEHLSPSDDMQQLDDVLHGNWYPRSIAWNTSSGSRPDTPGQRFPRIDLQIVVEHDFVDGVHKIFLPLTVIALASWSLLWLNVVSQSSYASPRIGGMVTLILTTIALKFVLDRELPVVHYLTLSDVLFNGTIIMLSLALLASCTVAALYTGYGAARAQAFNTGVRRLYPLLYLLVMLLGYFTMLD